MSEKEPSKELPEQKTTEDVDFEEPDIKTIVQLQREARETNDPKEKIPLYIEAAKRFLSNWGIDDLTTIEAVHLRNIVEKLLPASEEQFTHPEKFGFGDYPGGLHFDICEESAVQWLFQLYGINQKDVPEVLIIEDLTSGEKYKYERTMRKKGFKKEHELAKQGHEVDHYNEVPEDFKEYLRRLREKAHNDV